MEEHDLAFNDYHYAIRIGKQNPLAYVGRGNIYAERGLYEEAIADYTYAIELDPDYADACYNRGNAFSDIEDCHRAVINYTLSIERDPELSSAYYNRGLAYFELEDYRAAIHHINVILGAALQSFSRYLELAGEEADPYVVKQVRELEAPQVSPVILLTLIAAALLFRAARR